MISRHAWLSLLTLAALLFGPFAVAPQASQAQTADQTFTVDRLDDLVPPLNGDYCTAIANDCTLRQAILKANAATTTETKLINFANISGSISITNTVGLLPALGSNITLQGRTSLITGRPLIQIVGAETNRSAGIRISGNNNTVSDLVIYGFSDAFTDSNGGSAIVIAGDNNTIIRNYIGVRTDGTLPNANDRNVRGIRIIAGADNNDIGQNGNPNVIGGNQGIGVEVIDASDNTVLG
ncbi:MAG: hypothetical protein HC828_22300 [Blastochloris sp.]|nr:hypothetical protein [Blastochloris sp.]